MAVESSDRDDRASPSGGRDRPGCDSGLPSDHPAQNWLAEHGDALFAYACSRVRDRELAEELVQETFLAAIRDQGRFGYRSSLQTWLTGILRNKLADHFRRQSRVQSLAEIERIAPESQSASEAHPSSIVPASPENSDPSARLREAEFEHELRRCLDELPPLIRQAIEFRAFDQLGTEEISELLDISRNNVAARLHRARNYLRKCLQLRS